MKKIILGILSFLLFSPVFSYNIGDGYFSSIFSIGSSSGFSNYYSVQTQGRCVTGKQSFNFFGLGRYNVNNSFDFINSGGNIVNYSASDVCNYNSDNYLYVSGYNNGYYLDQSGNNVFLGDIFGIDDWYNRHSALGFFRFGLDSSSFFNGSLSFHYSNINNNHNNLSQYYFNLGSNFNYSNYTNLVLPYLIYYSDYNIYNYWDSSNIYTPYGSYNDVGSGCIRLAYIPNYDGGYSFIYNCNGEINFKTIFGSDINYTIFDEFSSVDISDYNRNYLFLHFYDYTSDYINGKLTLILQNTSSGVLYNIYSYFSDINSFSGSTLLRKGYISNESSLNYSLSQLFNNINYFNNNYFEFFGNYSNGFTIRDYVNYNYNNSNNLRAYNFQFTFNEDNSVSTINLDGDKGSSSLTTGKVEQLLDIYCNQLHLINPALCNNNGGPSIGSGAFTYEPVLSGDQVVLVITDYSDTNDYIIHTGDNGDIWIECVGDWCPIYNNTGSSDIGFVGGSGFILDTGYYENFFNKTGYFAKCPYPYTDLQIGEKLKIVQKIKNSIGDFDIFLPINCSIAAFTAGKTYKFLSDVDIGLNPLMGNIQNFEDPRLYLYRFFDFLMSFALLVFLLKIYHLLN